ncbi:helix-turn-helix domain-containing protein [Streptomyces sp. NPDC059866]|uniref:helix-turn-helix domain-containing protein n=1 Tax=Streptomyces sp. NPDC059866 TaxID=3346978 RepID=UPI00364CA2C7
MSDTCEYCGSALAGGPGKGRPRKYCGDACRQAAHRRRLHGDTTALPATPQPTPPETQPEQRPLPRTSPAARTHGPSAGDEILTEIAKDIQDSARDLARFLPSCDGEEPLRRIAQLHEQLDGLTAAVVGRARYRRVTWTTIGSILRISEDTARHRYTERHILRRLARFNRSETALTSLASAYTAASPHVGETPDETAGSDTGNETFDAGTERDEGPDQSTPSEPSGAAYNRLAPILSMLIRTAQLTNKEVSGRIGCSASYLSRILSGERVPTWDLTRKFAQACGADPEVLRTVWESEKLSQKSRDLPPDPDEPPLPAAERLRAAVHTLHLRAGRPAPYDVAVASRWLLSASAVASILEATILPHHDVLETFVRVLGGDVDHFKQLLDNAHREAAHGAELLHSTPAAPPTTAVTVGAASMTAHPDTHPPQPHPTGADAIIKTFSAVLTEDETVEDGRARLLHKLAKQHEPARQADSGRTRPPTALAEALRHRALPPAHSISPLRAST